MNAYDDSWECPHAAGPGDLWQESDCYWFYDGKSGIGGYHRIGYYPNRGTGQTLLFVFRSGGLRFRRLGAFSGDACHRRLAGQTAGFSTADFLGEGRMRFTWTEDDSAGELIFSDPFYKPRSWTADETGESGAGAVRRSMNTGGHLEVSGRLRGRIRLGTDWFELDALAHRDRSWGERDYRAAWQHRMVTGTVGPELSWASYIIQLDNGHVARAGFVARNGDTTDLEDVRVLTEIDTDGLSVSAVKARLVLRGGAHIDLSGRAADAFMAVTEDWLVSSHTIIPLKLHGTSGFTVLDMTNRPGKGHHVPGPADVASICAGDGLQPARAPLGLP